MTNRMNRLDRLSPTPLCRFVLLGAITGGFACDWDGSRVSRSPCELPADVNIPTRDSAVIAGEPMCGLEFEELVRLEGSADETLPRDPIAERPEGGYITATYEPGRLALWTANGDVERVIGRGEGQGPGEFEHAHELYFRGDTIIVFDGSGRMHRYMTTGEFVDQMRAPGGNRGAILPDGTPIVSVVGEERFVLLEPGGTTPFGPPRGASRSRWYSTFAVSEDRIWEAVNINLYEVRQYPIDDPTSVSTLRREVAWFPHPSEQELREGLLVNSLGEIVLGASGLVWVRLEVVDVEGPPFPELRVEEPAPFEWEDRWEYFDGRIEAFLPDGTLVASEVFEDPANAPQPMIDSDLWYLREDDKVVPSFLILEPRLSAVAR